MGRLIDGQWSTEWYEADAAGRFLRDETRFRDSLSRAPGARFPALAGRYHLYVSLACPWAHRTLIVRALRQLDDAVSVSVVHPFMGDDGWSFDDSASGATGDTVEGHRFLRDLYVQALESYTGRVTVPVLWDRETHTIVNNESRQIIRMLGRELGVAGRGPELCPPSLEADIDREIDAMYEPINNGVYRAGFATKQPAYDEAVGDLFSALDRYEARLAKSRYLLGAELTEADVCLFTTLVRFDSVYHYHFKCNLRRLRDYPSLWAFTRELAQHPRIGPTVNLEHIKRHYFESHPTINPTRIVPRGPIIDWREPHGRSSG